MIRLERPGRADLEKSGVFDWPVWSKEVSEFPWEYDMEEVCYILEGRAEIISNDGEEVVISSGDLVTFPCGMKCRWKITSPIRKHYDFR